MTAADPGATPTTARALAPDLARGGMLLLIALANVHFYWFDRPLGVRAYPRDLAGAERFVVLVQMLLVDGRAYPLFGFLFGYGIVQLAWRRSVVGLPADAVVRLVRRRGRAMILIGLVHGVLLWSGDIVGAYGLIAVVFAGMLVRGSDAALFTTAGITLGVITLLYSLAGLVEPGTRSPLESTAAADPLTAALNRTFEWVANGLLVQALGVVAAVALGAWAARRRLLDEPGRHVPVLRAVAVGGLGLAVLGGLPLGLVAAQLWAAGPGLTALAFALHALAGYAGGLGYAALFGLLAVRLARPGPGPAARAVVACGQRSLSCYLAQSVAFVALLPAWTLGLGEGARMGWLALAAIGVWLVILLVAAASQRAGYRGPAEKLLRRATYGPPRTSQPA